VGALLGAPAWELDAGLWGYNGVIAAMSVCGVFYAFEWVRGVVIAVLCTATSTVLQGAFKAGLGVPSGLPVLTLPFCCGAIVWLLAGWPTRIPVLLATTAEDHAVAGTWGVATLQRVLGVGQQGREEEQDKPPAALPPDPALQEGDLISITTTEGGGVS
jgi:hypothetical protein